jgi:hypothetical protein
MAATSSATLVNTPRRMRSSVIKPKKRSTSLLSGSLSRREAQVADQ